MYNQSPENTVVSFFNLIDVCFTQLIDFSGIFNDSILDQILWQNSTAYSWKA